MGRARELLHSWNVFERRYLQVVKIEEDIRDALQSVRAVQPSTMQRKALLKLSSKVGVHYTLLGFPAASKREHEQCSHLIDYISAQELSVQPVLMARPIEDDLGYVFEIQERSSISVAADVFISISALRLSVEGWTLDGALARLRMAADVARKRGVALRISLEDSTRTGTTELARSVEQVLDMGPEAITLCDTVGDCLPDGAASITAFVRDLIDRSSSKLELGWHGHNDRGLGLANAIASVNCGADVVSGTFMGVGERTGNVPLEQLIIILSEAGNKAYDISYLCALCELLSSSSQMQIPFNLPIVGKDAFSTSAGTHVAAILRAGKLGSDFEDLMFSAVEAGALGRKQAILIGPNSGRSAVRAVLAQSSLSPTEEMVSFVLDHCKGRDRCFYSAEEIVAFVAQSAG
jgi:isopropylmalate/homocitrate/citramalate synthase